MTRGNHKCSHTHKDFCSLKESVVYELTAVYCSYVTAATGDMVRKKRGFTGSDKIRSDCVQFICCHFSEVVSGWHIAALLLLRHETAVTCGALQRTQRLSLYFSKHVSSTDQHSSLTRLWRPSVLWLSQEVTCRQNKQSERCFSSNEI